ncbi:polyprenyl synthetase family protein [Pectinatus haikarae]|uniref:Geranylgeranyl diphosphate synthase type II n=1 Tax=Pectinatus haikarae TaxID=349096 RepID=A0ABT9Y6Q2_9FIRM|nr:farnesyl diphosphate synthase [Pectinatus haikarae]MDQ0203409.1 geranylgeranyl diphosphate synthase type II [Pectinatus haikarae]
MNEYMQHKVSLINEALSHLYSEKTALNAVLADSMNYSLKAGGKRLRPVMLMAAADAVGANGDKYVRIACAMEMIHTYSLIHDDLPAMDNDDYRRGKLTNHKVYGDAMAVLAGDALLTMAFEVIASEHAVDPSVLLRISLEISRAAGPEGMVGGQALDLSAENRHIELDELRKLHSAKTGALFRAAIRTGGILAKADQNELASLTRYADEFGLAFQITDDILDVIGDDEKIGKPVGSDEKNHKSTYVSLLSLSEARKMAEKSIANAVEALEPFGSKAEFLRGLVKKLLDRQN